MILESIDRTELPTLEQSDKPVSVRGAAPLLLHTLFLNQAAVRPDELAVITPTCRLTYGELHRRALQIAIRLLEAGVAPNTLVAIVMKKGWEQIVAVLGVLYAGAAYLPIATDLPAERRRYLLRHGEVKAVLTQGAVEWQTDWPAHVQVICINEEGETAGNLEMAGQGPEDLAYVMYTSGSTGLPKGVMIDHRGAVNTILDMNRRFAITPADRVLALSSLSFDLSVYDIFGTLAAGGAIVLPAAEDCRDPVHWAALVAREGVTIWNSVPALMKLFCDHAGPVARKLRWVWLSGDWIPLTLPAQIHAIAPRAQVVSLGGATEASIWSIAFPIETVDPSWKSIPYGRAMLNQTVQVLGDDCEPCPPLVAGQLYIGGAGVARGYWRDPERTAESFFIHPASGERLYRTGDLGRWLPDGNIEFLGRVDFQVKIRGCRVELEEIEAVLRQYPGVDAAVVTLQAERLVAYVVPQQAAPAPSELRRFLLGKLPEYMVPGTFLMLDRLPHTANGKIDRRALPAAGAPDRANNRALVAPRSPLEKQVVQIWVDVLRIPEVGVHDDFFELGGNSLAAVQIISRVNSALALALPVRDLFDDPTVARLTGHITGVRAMPELCEMTGYL